MGETITVAGKWKVCRANQARQDLEIKRTMRRGSGRGSGANDGPAERPLR
jgi:hypothetical protein